VAARQDDRVGERVNYVVVDGQATELYYATWGAGTIDLDLLHGPAAALRRIRRRSQRCDVLLDPVWCEGAALVDVRRRVLALFMWHCEGYAHRAALHAVLADTWPGWHLRWAYGGIEEIAAYAGRPVVPDRRSDPPHSLLAVDAGDPAELDECNLLVTVAEPDRPARSYAMWTDVNGAFWFGPALLSALPQTARVTHLPRLPDSGLHLDPAGRTVAGWTTLELAGLDRDWSRCWPGWRFTFHQDRYETQLAHCRDQLRVPRPDLSDGLDTLGRRVTAANTSRRDPTFDEPAATHASIDRVRTQGSTPRRWPGLGATVGQGEIFGAT
jgi:hypothetical protein